MTIWARFGPKRGSSADGSARTGPTSGLAARLGLEQWSDDSLAVELERRRSARQRPAHRRSAAQDDVDAMIAAQESRRRDQRPDLARGALEITTATSPDELDRAFRAQLRRYHPDRHIGDPERHRTALAVAARLIDAYAVLRRLS